MPEAKPRKPLTHDRQADTAKPEEKPYHLNAGEGLFLEVQPTGGKLWRYRATVNGKRILLSMGKYPAVGLAEAKARRDEANRQIEQGIDPREARKAAQVDQSGINTFEATAREWIGKQAARWNPDTVEKCTRRFEMHAFPDIGRYPIDELDAPTLLKLLERIELASTDIARRLLSDFGAVFRYGQATGRTQNNPAAALKGALKPHIVKNYAALVEPFDFAELLRDIDQYRGSYPIRQCLRLAALFFVRPGELRQAQWTDFDLTDRKEWSFYSGKAKKHHIVPLCRQAIAILQELHQYTGHTPYVFAVRPYKPSPPSENTINKALRSMGYDTQKEMTGHGFRAAARTILHERCNMDPHQIEHQLTHSVPDSLGTAYNRTKFLEQRRAMMQVWGDYLDTLKDPQVIQFARPASA